MVIAVALHGVAHTDDLGVQAFARHLTAAATDAGRDGQPIIAGMRAFLEGKPHLAAAPPWSAPGSAPPATGYQAVELLARAAGCTEDDVARARRASRQDLAGSAWILEPADGVDELFTLVDGRAAVLVVAADDDPATPPVLDALGLTDRFAVEVPAGPALVVDTAWTPRLAGAHATGQTTALLDRFGSGAGHPDLRAADLPGLLPGIAAWLDTTVLCPDGTGGPA